MILWLLIELTQVCSPRECVEPLTIVKRLIQSPSVPRLADQYNFPERWVLVDGWAFNRAHGYWLRGQAASNPDRDYRPWIAENDRRCRVYYQLMDARTEFYYVWARRLSLAEARKLMTEDEWRWRRLPPCVPLEFFRYDD